MTSGIDVTQATIGSPKGYISSLKLPVIQEAALAACGGTKDGFINDPASCHFDPGVLLCKATDSIECLTQPEVDSLKKYYTGGKVEGKTLIPGYAMGDETSWASWVLGHGPGSGSGSQYVQNYFRYMVSGDPKFNMLTADVHTSYREATERTAADLDATSPDLSKLAARGGKLILYHGWNDPAISPWNTIAYYQDVQRTMGEQKAAGFVQLYMVPGMEHCAGGPGPSAFGQLGIPGSTEPKFGVFDALVDWVERAIPPNTVVATKYGADSKAAMTRPLCPYPAIAKYKGTGDTSEAANFICGKN